MSKITSFALSLVALSCGTASANTAEDDLYSTLTSTNGQSGSYVGCSFTLSDTLLNGSKFETSVNGTLTTGTAYPALVALDSLRFCGSNVAFPATHTIALYAKTDTGIAYAGRSSSMSASTARVYNLENKTQYWSNQTLATFSGFHAADGNTDLVLASGTTYYAFFVSNTVLDTTLAGHTTVNAARASSTATRLLFGGTDAAQYAGCSMVTASSELGNQIPGAMIINTRVIPEPATTTLALCSLAALACRRPRRRA